MTRVLYVIDALGEGGTERSLADLLPSLVEHGVEPFVATLRSRGAEGVEYELRDAGFDIRVLGDGRFVDQLCGLEAVIRDTRPDVVHTMLYRSNLLGRLAGRRRRIPVVSSVVNTVYSPARLADPRLNRFKVSMARWLDAWTARRYTARIHAVSQAVKDDVVAALALPAERVEVIERGRDAERLGEPSEARRVEARRMLGVDPDAEVVVNVGRHEFQKGHRHLLEATALLRDRERLVVLVAGREGTVTSEVESIRDRLQLDNVRLLGHRPDVTEVLAAADVFAFPSLYEGLPGAVVEAMALGLPVVASDIAPVTEVVRVGENALVVPPEDAAALARAIATLLDDPDRRVSMGRCSREIFEAGFRMGRSAARMADLYRQIHSQHLGRPVPGRD